MGMRITWVYLCAFRNWCTLLGALSNTILPSTPFAGIPQLTAGLRNFAPDPPFSLQYSVLGLWLALFLLHTGIKLASGHSWPHSWPQS
jgi:hypothetical protein